MVAVALVAPVWEQFVGRARAFAHPAGDGRLDLSFGGKGLFAALLDLWGLVRGPDGQGTLADERRVLRET